MDETSLPGRTDRQIVDQTNELARQLLKVEGFHVLDSYLFYESNNARSKKAWSQACLAQCLLTNTDPNEALTGLEEIAVRSHKAAPKMTTPDEEAHYVAGDDEDRGYWRQFLTCSDGGFVGGQGVTKAEATLQASARRAQRETFLQYSPAEQLREIYEGRAEGEAHRTLRLLTQLTLDHVEARVP